MITYPEAIAQLQTELEELQALRKRIQSEGQTAPAKYTIDSTTNPKGVIYYRLREGRTMIRGLGREGSSELSEWKDRIRRRNAVQALDSHAKQINALIETLEKGIDYSFHEPTSALEIDQAEYIPPGAA